MAAKPPKPPGNFLKSLLNQHNNNKNQQHNNDGDDNKEANSSSQHLITATASTIATPAADSPTTATVAATKKSNCNCSNISIMHLFHEMKQDFPTIPDTIVAQCVNENCHQRENCIQMLKNELELNPIPAQSYPAKVLHPPNNSNHNLQNSTNNHKTTATPATTSLQKPPLQQKPLVVQQKPPLKPIKPVRAAPLKPVNQQQSYNHNNSIKINSTFTKNTSTTTTTTKPLGGEDLANNENVFSGGASRGLVESNDMPTKITLQYEQSIAATAANNSDVNSTLSEVCKDDKACVGSGGGGESTERNVPRQRPTTLNLNTQLQKQQLQQRQRLNLQLQQRFQEQRNRQQPPQNTATTITKPIRKAPLPPIAPKPTQFHLNHSNANVVNSSNHTTTSPLSESEISLSVSLSTPSSSPTSSSSPSTTTHHHHHPSNKPTTNQQHLQTKSPIRHRSVITLQPEPPYTRDFLFSPASLSYASSAPSSPSLAAPPTAAIKQTTATNSSSSATSSPTASLAGSQKSFTSVNLTLRPPVSPNGSSTTLQPSTIDITAGPGFSGASGGGAGGKSLHYSSTSYDARLGYQQNFQITVTDECGVFSASRIRPQQQQQHQPQRCLNQVNIRNENQYDHNSNKETITDHNHYINSFLNTQQQQQQQQFHNNNVVALQQNIQNSIQTPQGVGAGNSSSGLDVSGVYGDGSSSYISGNMCLPPQQATDAATQEILERQKKRRDKLAAALREYKKRLVNVEQEINLLTGTTPLQGMSERLDEEIIKLRRDCQDMLRSNNTFTQPPSQQELAINYQPQRQMYQQQQLQPFPRQRLTRTPQRPPQTPRQTSLDIIQHHSQTTTPHTPPPAASLPNLNIYNSSQQQQQVLHQHTNFPLTTPPYYLQQTDPVNGNFINNNELLYTDHHSNYIDDQEDLVEDDNVDDYDEYDEVVEPWECNMCTFRNHPQLNICETCENVRISGRQISLSRALSTTNITNISAATAAGTASVSNVSPNLGVLRGAGTTNNSSRNGLNAANGNLEHDTNLIQQQFALHT